MNLITISWIFLFTLCGCLFTQTGDNKSFDKSESSEIISRPEKIIAIDCPDGFARIELEPFKEPFSIYVQNLPLKPKGEPVRSYDGSIIHDCHEIAYVIDWEKPSKVQQCADVAIRLYAEYLREQGKIEKVKFKSLSDDEIIYSKWLRGVYKLGRNGITWTQSKQEKADSDEEFNRYLNFVMKYANSSSLARDLKPIDKKDILPGDLYIQPDSSGRGGIGHLSVVLDMCENENGEKLFLFGYGFIPAQDFHIPLPMEEEEVSPWFSLDGFKGHAARFGDGKFHRFE